MENYLGVFGRMLTPLLLNQLQWRLGVSASQLRPVDHIENVECPMFIISGKTTETRGPPTHGCLLSVRGIRKKFGSCLTLGTSIYITQRDRNTKRESWLPHRNGGCTARQIGFAHETREKTRKISGRRSTEYLFITFLVDFLSCPSCVSWAKGM